MLDTLRITPFMHVRELEPAIAFLEEVLGFETILRVGRDYAYLEREGAGMRVLARAEAIELPPRNGRIEPSRRPCAVGSPPGAFPSIARSPPPPAPRSRPTRRGRGARL